MIYIKKNIILFYFYSFLTKRLVFCNITWKIKSKFELLLKQILIYNNVEPSLQQQEKHTKKY